MQVNWIFSWLFFLISSAFLRTTEFGNGRMLGEPLINRSVSVAKPGSTSVLRKIQVFLSSLIALYPYSGKRRSSRQKEPVSMKATVPSIAGFAYVLRIWTFNFIAYG